MSSVACTPCIELRFERVDLHHRHETAIADLRLDRSAPGRIRIDGSPAVTSRSPTLSPGRIHLPRVDSPLDRSHAALAVGDRAMRSR